MWKLGQSYKRTGHQPVVWRKEMMSAVYAQAFQYIARVLQMGREGPIHCRFRYGCGPWGTLCTGEKKPENCT